MVIDGFDLLKQESRHTFVRCIHNLLSMTEAVGLADDRADLRSNTSSRAIGRNPAHPERQEVIALESNASSWLTATAT